MGIEKVWENIDDYFSNCFIKEDKILQAVLENCKQKGLPDIRVSNHQAMLLHILVKMQQAKNILEIGTLGGYSAIHMARALGEDGHLTTVEYEREHAEVAAENFEKAGLRDKITLIHSDGKSALQKLIAKNGPAFDFVFLDADKRSNPVYLELCLQLVKKGAVIVCDNIVREGQIMDSYTEDKDIQGIRKFCQTISQKDHLITSAIQTVGSKGYDGFSLTFVQ